MALQNVEYKFLLIPLAFIILRVWSCILVILFVYVGMDPTTLTPTQAKVMLAFVILMVGIYNIFGNEGTIIIQCKIRIPL